MPRAIATWRAARSRQKRAPCPAPRRRARPSSSSSRRDRHARDPAGVEDARRRPREDEHVRQQADRQPLLADPLQQLVVLAGVVADLVHDEPGAVLHLLAQLQQLRHDLVLVALVVRRHRAEEELRALDLSPSVPAVDDRPLVHVAVHAQQADGVDVEDGRRDARVAADRRVAGQGEDVVEPLGGQLPRAALDRVAVPVLAGEVDDHLLPAGDEVGPHRVGRQHRVAGRVVGDREDVDPRVRDQLAGDLQRALGARLGDQPAAGDELRRRDEAVGLRQEMAERRPLCDAAAEARSASSVGLDARLRARHGACRGGARSARRCSSPRGTRTARRRP